MSPSMKQLIRKGYKKQGGIFPCPYIAIPNYNIELYTSLTIEKK
jgi:hypothetical protein